MNQIFDYYNNKVKPFGIGERRARRIFPLIRRFKNKKILDVGCATGYIGSELRKKGNYVVGIDITRKDIDVAKKILNEAYVFDIESSSVKTLGKNFDVIIISEVLEHLFDPEGAIKRFLPLLKSGGVLLLTTPNIVHIYVRLKFMLGIFNYKEETVVNKSHIHFFTRKSFMDMLKNLHLKIICENDVICPEFLRFILQFWPNIFAHQVIVLCQVTKEDK